MMMTLKRDWMVHPSCLHHSLHRHHCALNFKDVKVDMVSPLDEDEDLEESFKRHKRGKRRRIGCLQISMQKTSKANPNNDLEAKANILSLSPNHAVFWMQEMNSNFQIDHQCKSTIMMPPFNSCPTQGTCGNFGTQRSNAAVTDCKSKKELVEVL
jgi:hypothetical protein